MAGDNESVSNAVEPTEFERSLVARCLERIQNQVLYARLDLIQDEAGSWLISELELIEPSLYFLQCPYALQKFVAAVKTRCSSILSGAVSHEST